MAKVFVSYSRKDIDFAKRLTAELQKSELDFWIDWEGIHPTVDWWKAIEKGIQEADAFLFLISPDSAKSKICGQEIDTAVKNGKRIIPVVVREIEWKDSSPQLRHLNYIFFSRDDDFDTAVKKLLTAIHTDYEWAATHRRLQVKALEWDRKNKENSFLLRGKDLLEAEQQLATNSSKDPHPTDLQREYVHSSRQETNIQRETEDRRRRNITRISIIGLIVMAALAVFGFNQAKQATSQRNAAVTAQANESIAKDTAVASEQEAIKQAQIALARLWVAEANTILAKPDGNTETAALLSIYALQQGDYIPSADGALIESLNRLYTEEIFNQHFARVSTVAYSPRGDQILIGFVDGIAILYDVKTGAELKLFEGFAEYQDPDGDPRQEGIHSAIFSPSGDSFLIAGSDGHIQIWDQTTDIISDDIYFDIYSGEYIPQLLWSAKFSPNENYILISAGPPNQGPGEIFLFDRQTKQWKNPVHILHQKYIRDLEISQDGKFILSTSEDITVLWKVNWQTLAIDSIHSLKSPANIVDGAISANGDLILIGLDNDTAELYTKDGVLLNKFIGHTDAITSVAISPINGYILTGSLDGTARLWDIKSGKNVRTFANHKGPVYSLAFSPNGKSIITGSYDNSARLWAADPIHGVRTIYGHTNRINNVSYSTDGKYILSSSSDDTIYLWNSSTFEPERNFTTTPLIDPKAVFSAGGNWIAASSGKYQGTELKIVLWKKVNNEYIQLEPIILDPTDSAYLVRSLVFSPPNDGKESNFLLVGYAGGILELLRNDGIEWKSVQEYLGTYWPTDVAFTSDLQYLATGNETYPNNSIYAHVPVYHTDGEDIPIIDCISALSSGDLYGSIAIAFSTDSKYLVAEKGNDILILDWHALTGYATDECTEVKRLSGHTARVTDLAFSPDGSYLLSASKDGTAIIWDTTSWRMVRTLIGHNGEVTSIAFSPDSKFVVTGGGDHTIRIWDIDYKDTVKLVCSLLQRDFTQEELTKYGIVDYNPTCRK